MAQGLPRLVIDPQLLDKVSRLVLTPATSLQRGGAVHPAA